MAWTLSFELFFYLLLGVALAVRHPRWRWALIAAPSLLALVYGLVTGTAAFAKATSPLTLLASPYQWEFLLGCGVAVLTGFRLPWLVALRRQRPVIADFLQPLSDSQSAAVAGGAPCLAPPSA